MSSSSASRSCDTSVGVIGSGIGGLAAAWLLACTCRTTLYEKLAYPGGHCNTIDTPDGPIDTGFIVYNERNYPNLTRLFEHLAVKTAPSNMSFGVSIDSGKIEYAGRDLPGLFAQPTNLLRPAFLRMLFDIIRFYRQAPALLQADPAMREKLAQTTLGEFLHQQRYGEAFISQHIIPMTAAIWSTPASKALDAPLASFVDFCTNHGLLQLQGRPQWRTVAGGSRCYVRKLLAEYEQRGGKLCLNTPVTQVARENGRLVVSGAHGSQAHDHVVFACHADAAGQILVDANPQQAEFLDAFSYQQNRALLHTDASLMPKRKRAWCSWNYLDCGKPERAAPCVSYWMNSLQPIASSTNYFVTLNPPNDPRPETVLRSIVYEHPLASLAAQAARQRTWQVQGQDNIWFCGAHLGFGFHEDGIQSGLAVGEAIGGVARPWSVDPADDRINLPAAWHQQPDRRAAQSQ